MKQFQCISKKDIYTAEISDSVYGGVNLVIYRIRQGKEPKAMLTKHCRNTVEARMEMEKYLPEANWREK